MSIINWFDKKNPTIEKAIIITIPYGFVPKSGIGNVKIYTSIDTSDLTVFNKIEREQRTEYWTTFPILTQKFLLKGVINYNVTLDGFKPYEPVDAGEVSDTTSFAASGVIPVNVVLYKGRVTDEYTIDYNVSLTPKEEFLINDSAKVIYSRFWNREYVNNLRNPSIQKTICIPVVIEFKPIIEC